LADARNSPFYDTNLPGVDANYFLERIFSIEKDVG